MNRKQFLRKLLQKTQQSHQYYQSNINPPTQLYSPQPIIKRFQVLQLGSCHIGAPTQVLQSHICQKQKTFNRKILTVQRVKSAKKKQQNIKKSNQIGNAIRNQIQSYKQKQTFYNLKARDFKEQNNEKQNGIEKLLNVENKDQIYGKNTLNSKRSLTLSDSINQINIDDSNRQQKLSLDKTQQKVRHLYSQSNNIFNRNFSQRKANIKNQQQIVYKPIKDNRKLQNQTKILLKKQLLKNYAKPFVPPPKISAKAYIIYQKYQDITLNQQFKIHASLNSKNSLQIASLTKIMTCLLAINICQKYQLQAKQQKIKIGKYQSNIGGTSAKIQYGDIYTLQDLYYGLMLPSGNDASLAIAVWGGRLLLQKQNQKNPISIYIQKKYTKKQCYQRYIRQMNTKSRQLGMMKTNYANSHGLNNTMNRSCAYDIAHLSQQAMQNRIFRQIVNTKQYKKDINVQVKNPSYEQKKLQKLQQLEQEQQVEGQSQQVSDQQMQKPKRLKKKLHIQKQQCQPQQPKYIKTTRSISWQNTHKLLWKKSGQYQGIKTGVTTAAGPCLSTLVKTQDSRQFYIVLLNCRKLVSRFKQTQTLKKWIYKQQGIKSKNKTTYSISMKDNDQESQQKSQEEQI